MVESDVSLFNGRIRERFRVRHVDSASERLDAPPSSRLEACAHGDLRIQCLRYRAARLRLLCKFLELRLIDAGDLGREIEVTARDRKAIVNLFDRNGSMRLNLLSGEPCLTENQRQCHGEAACMRSCNQFFRVRARASLEARLEAVRRIPEHAGFGG